MFPIRTAKLPAELWGLPSQSKTLKGDGGELEFGISGNDPWFYALN
jgi:hypothetical protein